jgi:hypothetical protein
MKIFCVKRTMYHKYTLTYQNTKKNEKTLLSSLLNPPAVKSTPRGNLLRLFIKKNLWSEIQISLTIRGFPPHKLVLKVNCIVLLIRNLNTKEALVNGTRMRIKFMHRSATDCEVFTGTARNKRILIPRINLTYSYFTI